MGMNTDAVQRLYVAYFNRPADPVSLAVYESLLPSDRAATQAELQAIADTYFSPSAEYQSLYAGMSNTQIVDQLYQNIFGRSAEVDGLVYWAAELTAGRQTVASIALQLSYSAQGTDADVVANRIEAANAFTESLNTADEITGYSGDAAAASARTWLATVGSDAASKDAAIAGVDTAVSDAVAAGTAVAGETYNLTTAADDFTGKAGDDSFVGEQNGGATQTYTLLDKLDGGDGYDTFTLVNTESNVDAATAAAFSNIEHLIYRATDTTNAGDIDMANFTGVTKLTLDRPVNTVDVDTLLTSTELVVSQAAANFNSTATYGGTLTGTADSASVTFAGITDGAELDFSGDVETMNITVSAASRLDDLVFDAGTETININAAAALTVDDTWTAAGATKLDIDGAGAVTISQSLAAATATVDASGSTGKITTTFGNVAEAAGAAAGVDVTYVGSDGVDTVDTSNLNTAREVSISTGKGDDVIITDTTLVVDANDSVDGGDGDDTLRYTSTTTLDAQFSDVVSNIETIEASGTSTITLASLSEFAPQNFLSTVNDSAGADDDSGLVTLSLDGLVSGATVTLNATSGVTQEGNTAEANDGVEVNLSLATDATADSVTINAHEGYTEISDDTEDDFETVTLNYLGTADAGINTLDFGSATTLNINSNTGKDLTLTAVTVASTAVVDASGSSDDITATLSAVKSYTGSSETNTITLAAGDLDNAGTFTGGAAADDKLNATFSASQDAGIVSVTDFETLSLTLSGANTIDMRSSSGVNTIAVAAVGAGTDDLTVNRLAEGTAVSIGVAMDELVTSTQTGTSQTVKFTANVALDNLTLDAATTTLTINSDDGDTTAGEAMGSIGTDITGAALTTIIVTGSDDADISAGTPTTVTTVDGSASTGIVTATLTSTGTNTIKGGSDADVLTGAGGKDTFTGGKGDDTLDGNAGVDTYVFADSAANNGTDTIEVVVADDKLDFSAFGAITFEQNGGAGSAITPIATNGTTDIDITNKLVLLDDVTAADDGDILVDTAAEIAALIDGAGDALSITAGGKGIVVAGNATVDGTSASDTYLHIYFVEDLNGDGDVSDTGEVVKVAISDTDFDLDTLTTGNFVLGSGG